MATAAVGGVLKQLGRLFSTGSVAGLGEAQLLERFVNQRDEAAFEAIVGRHGPMVLAVCRRRLGTDQHAIDDAFQATFLVLVRRASAIRDGDRLGPWLYGVANRVAKRARADQSRRRDREKGGDAMLAVDPESTKPPNDAIGPELHEELDRLPTAYRDVIVLCDLEGRTHDEAARLLRWPIGTVKGRLSRAREKLRERLTRRGLVAPSAAILATLLESESKAAVPPLLVDATVRAAMGFAAGASLSAAGVVSTAAIGWTEGVLNAMFWTKIKIALGLTLALGTVATSGVMAYQFNGKPGGANTAKAPEQAAAVGKPDRKSPQPEPPRDVEAARKSFAQARIELSVAEFERHAAQLRMPNELTAAYESSLNVIDVEQQAFGADFKPVSAYANHRDRMKALKSLTEPAPDVGKPAVGFSGMMPRGMGMDAVAERAAGKPLAAYYLAEAELWLAETRAGRPLTPSAVEAYAIANAWTFGTIALASNGAPARGHDPKTRAILAALDQPIEMPFSDPTPFQDVLNYIKEKTDGPDLPGGLPIYLSPASLEVAGATVESPVTLDLKGVPLKTTLRLLLRQHDLNYMVKDGLISIGSPNDRAYFLEAGLEDGAIEGEPPVPGYGMVPLKPAPQAGQGIVGGGIFGGAGAAGNTATGKPMTGGMR